MTHVAIIIFHLRSGKLSINSEGGKYHACQEPSNQRGIGTILYQKVQLLAQKDGVSLSNKVRDLIIEALEIQEDIYLADFAEEREKSWDRSSALTHEEVWS